jgi:uncharacterized membrane protein
MSQEIVLDSQLQSRKDLAWWIYLLHGVSLLFSAGAFSVILFIISILKRPDALGTFVYSHHTWLIRSYVWFVGWMIVGGVLFATLIGIPLAWLVWVGAWIWAAYRIVRGFLALIENQPMPV